MEKRKRPREDRSPSDDFKTPPKAARESDFKGWGVDATCRYLEEQGLEEWTRVFREHKITGVGLRGLNEENLKSIGVIALGDRLQILHSIKKLWQITAEPSKVFNDPIHGHVELHPLLIEVIDTPQFQRLRSIKQLGGTYYVFPGASHNRFEHSIGVGYLAGQLLQVLNERQPELLISRRDILCVQIAGLCHDLGHGPFSHLFDAMFIPKARPDLKEKKWKHETASLAMFDHLVSSNHLEKVMEQHGLVLPEDLVFIKEQIAGPLATTDSPSQWPYKGRKSGQSFLYEIVANKRNGIDVDKWDYFARDCHHLGIQNNFDFRRFLKFARVCNVEGKKLICTRDKEVGNLYDLFHTRNLLHRRAYQHKVSNVVEIMITEAFLKADKQLQFEGSEKRMFTLSTAIDDMEAFTKLTDQVFERILYSSEEGLADAREILHNIICRRLYKCVGETNMPDKKPIAVTQETHLQWAKEVAEARPETGEPGVALQPEDLIVSIVQMDYGMQEQNPINNVRFYSKKDPNKPLQIQKNQVSKLLPECFAEQLIRVYCKKTDEETLKAARKHFVQWCMNKDFSKPKDGDVTAPELTPLKDSWASNSAQKTSANSTSVNKARVNLQGRMK